MVSLLESLVRRALDKRMEEAIDRASIVERLRSHAAAHRAIYKHGGICGEALDLIEQDGRAIEALQARIRHLIIRR